MGKYKRVRENHITFVFKADDDDPEILHIYARHLTSIDDSLDVFFDPAASQTWNEAHRRFERANRSHTLFWFWLDEPGRVVMVVTCFTNE